MAAENVCRYNKFGYCKFGEVCRKFHNDELCEDTSCDPLMCQKRHPRECKYYRNFKICKFNPCKFSHVLITDDGKFKDIVEKVDNIENF